MLALARRIKDFTSKNIDAQVTARTVSLPGIEEILEKETGTKE